MSGPLSRKRNLYLGGLYLGVHLYLGEPISRGPPRHLYRNLYLGVHLQKSFGILNLAPGHYFLHAKTQCNLAFDNTVQLFDRLYPLDKSLVIAMLKPLILTKYYSFSLIF
jgi:hypothetical protein